MNELRHTPAEPPSHSDVAYRSPIRLGLFVGLGLWSLLFIHRSSYLSPDGTRYFALFEDAMISMRYAWNLVHSNGLVWNAGERVEGYTNLLMVLIMAGVQLVASLRVAPLVVQFLNLGMGIGAAAALVRLMKGIARESKLSTEELGWAQDVALVLLLTYYPFLYWTLLGMETTLLTWLLLASAAHLLEPTESRASSRRDFELGLLTSAAYLTRPDSLLFTGPMLVCLYWRSRAGGWHRRPWVSALVLGLTGGAQLLFRKSYYGEWAPNTYTLKATGIPLGVRLENGILSLQPFIWQVLLLLAVAVAAVRYGKTRLFSIFGLLLLGLSLCYQLWIGGDAFQGLWRLSVPVLPFVFAGAGFFLAHQMRVWRSLSARGRPALLGLAVALLVVWQNQNMLHYLALKDYPGRALTNHFLDVSIVLADLLKPGASVGVFSAGILPYYLPEAKAIDFLGKCDKHVARQAPHFYPYKGLIMVPGHNKYDLKYSVLQLKPTFIEYYQWFDESVEAEAKQRYTAVVYRGVKLLLDKSSPLVAWERIGN